MVKYGVLYEQGFRAKKNVENRTLKTWPLRKIVFVILYYTRRFLTYSTIHSVSIYLNLKKIII